VALLVPAQADKFFPANAYLMLIVAQVVIYHLGAEYIVASWHRGVGCKQSI